MTSGSEIDPSSDAVAPVRSAAPRSAPAKRHWTRRGLAGGLAAFGVVALAAAIVAPTGMALAEQPEADVETSFSLAVDDTQDLTVSVSGATISPVDRSSFEVYVTPKPTPPPEPEPASSTSGPSEPVAATPFYTGGGAPAEWMAAAGIASGDWGYVDYIVSRESGWNPNATNSSSGACGLVQALPCSKVPGNGYDPVDNLRWANGYATGRYGSWAAAHAFWTSNHWW
ncbi:transglycosylase SLT domain-containing protein [Microbacterium abyssi]|uniref:aggregation-promoting factor C-terminal-like domain-containing protein n=1 Tax=Microbacterium abyssi TaxID=2782166 RepID=UPI001E63E963|nr:transglycosylase SLT domain-containing protein [Microbacterium sp. A18JL241]